MNKFWFTFVLFGCLTSVFAQLKPGFDKQEYLNLLEVSAHNSGPDSTTKIPLPADCKRVYSSPVVGLDNKWELWIRSDNVAVISLRASIATSASWLENFYAAMIPAQGNLKINDSTVVPYQFARNSQATTHVGWSLGAILLYRDIRPKMDSLFQHGTHDFILIGHSQGAALANLVHSLIYYDQQANRLPKDLVVKSYCSAMPKPGNLYYAYDFEAAHRNWSFTVLNARDWVPEVPFSIQTTDDFNKVNGIQMLKSQIKKLPPVKRMALKSVYNKLDRPLKKARKNFIQVLGTMIYKFVDKDLKDFPKPSYANTMNYTRCGTPIILNDFDATYDKRFPQDVNGNFLAQHSYEAYIYLIQKL